VRGARGAHLASALERLVAAHRRERSLHPGDARHAPVGSGTPENDRPSPELGDGRSLPLVALQALDGSELVAAEPSSACQLPSAPRM
jgi:hypothetical protein